LKTNGDLNWIIKKYDELTRDEFHDIIALRIEVFVVEQNCPYQELDGNDKIAWHVYCVNQSNVIVGTLRILPKDVIYPQISISRVVVKTKYRGRSLGNILMDKAMDFISENIGEVPIRISAQEPLKKYYETHGFMQMTEMYLEDNIPHIGMVYTPKAIAD